MYAMVLPTELKRRGLMLDLARVLGEHRVTTSLKFHGKIARSQEWCETVAELLNVEVERICPWLIASGEQQKEAERKQT